MEHYQFTKPCGVCKKIIIADISSIGTEHQTIMALTHMECAMQVNGRIMGSEVETLPNATLDFTNK